MEGAGQQKTLAPSQTLKGRELHLRSRGATLIAFPFFQSHARSQRWRRLMPPRWNWTGKATFYWLLCCVGTTHLFLLACLWTRHRLSSASRSRRRSEKAHPFRTSTLHRIAVGRHTHTMFVLRGSVL